MVEQNSILIEQFPGETRAALLEAGRVAELFVERKSRPSRLGEICIARVTSVRKDFGGAFVKLDTGEGFVKIPPKAVCPEEGALIVAQVTKDASGSKNIALRPGWEIKSANLVLTAPGAGLSISRKIRSDAKRGAFRDRLADRVPDDCGLTVRTSAGDTSAEALQGEFYRILESKSRIDQGFDRATGPKTLIPAPDLTQRLAAHFPGFELIDATTTAEFDQVGVEEAFDEAIGRVFEKDRDYRLVFDRAEALTAIDVDGAGTARVDSKAVNLKAAEEIVRLIRLRRDSGLIVIDFLRMSQKAARDAVFERLAERFRRDPVETRLHGWTKAGLFELTRQSSGPSIADHMCEREHPALFSAESIGLKAVRRIIRESRGVARPRLICAGDVAGYLSSSGVEFVTECEEKIGGPIDIDADPSYPRHKFEII